MFFIEIPVWILKAVKGAVRCKLTAGICRIRMLFSQTANDTICMTLQLNIGLPMPAIQAYPIMIKVRNIYSIDIIHSITYSGNKSLSSNTSFAAITAFMDFGNPQ